MRLVATVDAGTADMLTVMMAREGIDVAEAIRRMVAVGHMMYEEKASGRKIMTMDQDDSNPAEIVLF